MFRVAHFAKNTEKDDNMYDEDNDNNIGEEEDYKLPYIQASARHIDNVIKSPLHEDDFKEDFKYNNRKQPSLRGDFKFVPTDTLGMPCGFSVGHVEKQRKGEKKTFYCEMCLVELSSLDTMKPHVSGVKHTKKQMALSNDRREEKVRRGLMTEQEAKITEPRVKPIPNPESTKKKVPIRLQEKIRETRDPVVGLKFITEFIAVYPEMEPHYECDLCGSMGQSNGMFSHLMGHKHRQQQFVETIAGYNHSVSLSQAELLRKAKKYNENHLQLSSLIWTKRSDEDYPWPPGKVPWAVERGSSGIPPDGARDNFGENSHGAHQTMHEKRLPSVVRSEVVDKLPAPWNVQPPKSREEADKMFEVARRLVSMAVEFNGSGVSERDGRVIQTTLGSMMVKMQQIMASRRE